MKLASGAAPRTATPRLLCPQMYEGIDMRVTACTQCSVGWRDNRCRITMGCEHLPLVRPSVVPRCPMQHECRHQAQNGDMPCPVRARGMICESALRRAGVPDPESHRLSFHAATVATPEDIEYYRTSRRHNQTAG